MIKLYVTIFFSLAIFYLDTFKSFNSKGAVQCHRCGQLWNCQGEWCVTLTTQTMVGWNSNPHVNLNNPQCLNDSTELKCLVSSNWWRLLDERWNLKQVRLSLISWATSNLMCPSVLLRYSMCMCMCSAACLLTTPLGMNKVFFLTKLIWT